MILKSYEIENKKNINSKIFLIYGENQGLKRDLIKIIVKKKNYKRFNFDETDILNNPDNFYNLILSKSLFDPEKTIIINKITDQSLDIVDKIKIKNLEDLFIFLIAGRLEKKSKLRSYFEKEKKLVCIPCYKDNSISLGKIISSEIKNTKIKLSQESINLLINRSRGDRENLRNEINKLKNFSHNKKSVSYEEIKTLSNLAENYENEEIVNHCLSGDKKKLMLLLEENNFSSDDFFVLLKTLSRKVHRLIKIKILQQSEKNADQALNLIKPPIFWKEKDILKKQVNLWNLDRLDKIIKETNNLESVCKKNHEMAINIILNFLTNICFKINNSS